MAEAVDNKPTILVVDDSRLMRVAARKILKNDFNILEAADGEQAWASLQENAHVTLVMSDLSMPNLDGLGLLKRIRESENAALETLPVIIVTGAEDDDGSKNTALGAGASDFITKPFESVQLLARAKAQARQQRTQEALQQSEATKQSLEENASVDPLTGLANKCAFLDRIEEDLSYAMRHRTELAMLLVQVDKYKVLFLRRGKQTAEEILKRISGTLGNGRRREDTVARVGLDTFGILLPSANPIGARRVAEQLHAAIGADEFVIDDEKVEVTSSIAVSFPPLQGEPRASSLFEDAEEKLRLASKRGGNCIQFERPERTDSSATNTTPGDEPVVQEQPPQLTTSGIATAEDVVAALMAIRHGRPCEHDASALARAVLPVLKHWNKSQNDQHTDLLSQLECALGVSGPSSVEQGPEASLIR